MERALSIRLGDDLLVVLDLLARCRGRSIADEVRAAVRAHVAEQRNDPGLSEQVGAVLDRDREAARLLLAADSPAT